MIDANKIDLKKEIEELKKLSGKERGQDIKYLINYTRTKYGNDGVNKVEQELINNSYILPDIDKIDDMEWISESIPTIYMLVMVKVFNMKESDLFEMGINAIKFNTAIKLFIQFFITIEMTIKKTCQKWNKYYSNGEMKMIKYSTEKKECILGLYNFKKHPITCIYLMGALSGLFEMSVGKKVRVKEVKCVFKGDSYHEFVFNW